MLPNKVIIKQEVELVEVFTKLESSNKYSISDEQGNRLFFAYEDSKGFLGKQFFGSHRDVKLKIMDKHKKEVFTIDRPKFFLKSSATVRSHDGKVIGHIKEKRIFFVRQFDYLTPEGKVVFKCISRFPKIWTYKIFIDDREVAIMLKKFKGKDLISDADTFLIDFQSISDDSLKKSIIATIFAVDLSVFERKS